MTFSLTGYESIPNDGSGRVLITDINPNGENNDDALICHSEKSFSGNAPLGDWYLHPTQISTDEDNRIVSPPTDRGWKRNRGRDSEGHLLVRLRRIPITTAVEGVFTCDIPGDINTPRSVGIYYSLTSEL